LESHWFVWTRFRMLSLTCPGVLLSYSKTASYAVVPLYNTSPIGPERQVSAELWFCITVF